MGYLAMLVGCYHPDLRDCTVQCSAPDECADGQACEAGWCSTPGSDCHKEGGGGDLTSDAANLTIDARDLCPQGCTNGTCVDGVCVINCSDPWTCQNDITCPANLPCRVVCGDHSCAKPIHCEMSTSCEVQCAGDYACADEIQCNTHRCDVSCTGISSCKRRTRCHDSCACDVACVGSQSCAEVSECPAAACILGRGCTSQQTGCDKCP